MADNWRRDTLPTLVAHLATRPGHEPVRIAVTTILTEGLRCQVGAVTQEHRMPMVGGRADALFANTVFEFKRDLRHELPDVLARLPDYLRVREQETGRKPALGISTDGATFLAFELRDGVLTKIGECRADPRNPEALLGWLEPAVSDREDLLPDPLTIQRELGRESLTFGRAERSLTELWDRLKDHPEVRLKRDLWDGLLREVYGVPVGEDRLFLQHTYLTILAKTIAARVLDLPAENAAAILSGGALAAIGIRGAVESDFFDWVLQEPAGADLVLRLARQVARFRLRDVQQDVLKALYESLIDPEQRHDLGEYYTPDWLAAKVVKAAVTAPLTQRVLDPACGSGTFLFQAIRHLRAAGAALPAAERLRRATAQVRGLDVHPVAVIIARVTWLLALAEDIQAREEDVHVPVFLGDAMQWNISEVGDTREVRVPVPQETRPLRVPAGFAETQALLDAGVETLKEGLDRGASAEQVARDLRHLPGVAAADVEALAETYAHLLALYRAGRNGIWPFVLRNIVRPLWLSRPEQQADVLLGNPPWVAFRHLSAPMQRRLKEASQALNLWVGGVLATQQDLCALFTVRAVQRYLKPGGRVAFVLPYAVLNRPAHAGLRRGEHRIVQIRWDAAWSLDETVRPLFPVPASVLFGRRATAGPLPKTVTRFSGALPRRDATEAEADRALTVEEKAPWPPMPTLVGASPYRARFKNGATIFPRRFFFVERSGGGRLGASVATPLVKGRTSGQDKAPWKTVEPPSGPVERAFLRPVLLGEDLAPFRLLSSSLAVVPVTPTGELLDSAAARSHRAPRLAAWLADIEGKWAQHRGAGSGAGKPMTLSNRLDFQRNLSRQFPVAPIRVVYSASGTLLAATVVSDTQAVVEHKAYWCAARTNEEARYICAIVNAEHLRLQITDKQSKGQGGARDFDNLMWELPIPEYDAREALHRDLAALAAECEAAAAAVELPEGAHFTRHRRLIRDALDATGLARRLDALVARLLAP
jgi:SAM-dependent methyltransferase